MSVNIEIKPNEYNPKKMTIPEIAAQLGKAIKEDDRIKELNAARDAYETSEELRTLMTEYEVYSYEAFKKKIQDELRGVERAEYDDIKTTLTEFLKGSL